MLLVKTTVKPSPIQGLGLFAAEPIRAGTVVWRFDPAWDRAFTHEDITTLPEIARLHIGRYAYLSTTTGRWIMTVDNDRFWNHADEPNCLSRHVEGIEEAVAVAIRDISTDEELTDDYGSFCALGLIEQDFDPSLTKEGGE